MTAALNAVLLASVGWASVGVLRGERLRVAECLLIFYGVAPLTFAAIYLAMGGVYRSANYLAHHLAEAPVIIIGTIRTGGAAANSMTGASMYPALQNLMLAARALGLGTTLTTLHKMHEQEVKELLEIPDGVETMALIPVGWPKGKFGAPIRMPVEKVVYWDKWGAGRER